MGKEQDLLSASKSGDVQQVRKLLGKLRKAVSSSKLEPPAAEVAKDGKPKKIKGSSVLRKSSKFVNVNAADEDCFTALHHGALLEKADVCRELLEVDAAVDLRDKNGMTPLHLAAWAGRVEQANLLLRSGADPNAVSNNGETALILTAQYGKTDVASILLNHKADVGAVGSGCSTALDKACQFGHLEMVELLVKCGALNHVHQMTDDENKRDPNKQTPLHLAAKHGHMEIIRALLTHGVDVNLETANGTSLHEAALYGRKDIVKLLVECSVDVNRRNTYKQTALDIVQHFVKSAAAKEMKAILIESGCANVALARANFDHHVADSMMLSFSEGETIVILEQNAEGPWKGSVGEGESKRTGFFPHNAVTLLIKRPESLSSVAALVTSGGQVDPHLSPASPDALYDCLKPKMSDMPSPPVPVLDEKDEDAHPYGMLVRVAPKGKPKPLIRDQSFTGQYTFEVSKGHRAPATGVYEEVDLPLQVKLDTKKGLNYAQMELQPSNSAVRGIQPKTLYADVAIPSVPSNRPFVIPEEEEQQRRSSSLSHERKPAYENVEGFSRRAMSVSKPRPVPPARKSSHKMLPSYENVDLPEQTETVSPPPQPMVVEEDETYEVMDRALAGRSPTVVSDSEYLTMHRGSDPIQPTRRSRVESLAQSPPLKQVSPYEMMTLNKEGKPIPLAVVEAGPENTQPDIEPPTSPLSPLGRDMPTHPLPIVDWLMLFNLQDYSEAFVTAGYDDSSYLVEIAEKDLIALGIDKPGHRKKILQLAPSTVAALSDIFPSTKPSSVSDWFKALGMSLYEPTFLKQGYDDVDFVVDITEDELKEMGVTLQGHLRKLMVAIGKLSQLEGEATGSI